MARNWYKPMVLLMWVALPTLFWNYWRAWDHLPMRMAVHFDANWQPNGYTSREGALELGVGILVVLLILFTVSTLIVYALKPSAAWPALVIAYLAVGFCWYGNRMILDFNLKAQAAHSELVGARSPAASDSEVRIVLQPQW